MPIPLTNYVCFGKYFLELTVDVHYVALLFFEIIALSHEFPHDGPENLETQRSPQDLSKGSLVERVCISFFEKW